MMEMPSTDCLPCRIMFLVFNELKESVLERGIVMAVNEKLRDHLHDQLFRAILELKSVDECYEFFEDLCTIQEMKAISAATRRSSPAGPKRTRIS